MLLHVGQTDANPGRTPWHNRNNVMRKALLLALLAAAVGLTACGHKKRAAIAPPPPPPAAAISPVKPPPATSPISITETGLASWYGHPYHGRQAADGEIYDMETLVAAHRTLPFNTWVRVVNLRNSKVVEVRIIDRGPFINGRIIDLSHAAASAIDLIGPGIGPVRIQVIPAPSSALATPAPPGNWRRISQGVAYQRYGFCSFPLALITRSGTPHGRWKFK